MERTTLRPVLVTYFVDAPSDELHPSGVPAGTTTESATPEIAKRFHPLARIVRYSDGGEYNEHAYRAEIRRRDKTAEPDETDSDEQAVAAPAPRRTRSTSGKTSKGKTGKATGAAPKRTRTPKVVPVESPVSTALAGSDAATAHLEEVAAAEAQAAKAVPVSPFAKSD